MIVVDAALVNHFFPGQNPIGKSIASGEEVLNPVKRVRTDSARESAFIFGRSTSIFLAMSRFSLLLLQGPEKLRIRSLRILGSSIRIFEMFSRSGSISISFMKSCSLYSLASQKGSSPNTTNRLRWAATRRGSCEKSKTKGNSGMGNSLRSSLSAGR